MLYPQRNRLRAFAAVGLAACMILATTSSAQSTADTPASLLRSARYDEAIAAAKQQLQRKPNDPALHTIEAMAYSMKGNDDEALGQLHLALKSAPGFKAALETEAQILFRKRALAAEPVLKQILREDPTDTTAREMLAVTEARANACTDAIKDFSQAGEGWKRHSESLTRYAACLYQQEQYAKSADAFAQLIAQEPASAEARYDLALSQMRAGQTKQAAATLAPLVDGDDIDTLVLASDVFEAAEDTPNAVAAIRRAIVLDPTRAESYVRFAELCMLHESYQPGVDVVTAGIARLPKDSSLLLARGMLYGGLAQYAEAEADFRHAEALDPAHGTGSYGVGLVQSRNSHDEEALATTRSGLKQHPKNAQLHYLLARILIEGGAQPGSPQFVEAERAATEAVRLDPKLLAAHDMAAKIYGLNQEAKPEMQELRAALRLDPDDGAALYRLMRATRQAGNVEESQQLMKQIVEQHQRAREEETNRLRYRIEEASAPGAQDPPRESTEP